MPRISFYIIPLCMSVFLFACGSSKNGGTPVEIVTKTGIAMIQIPAGEFYMGDPEMRDDEGPTRRITIHEFYMDKFEVSQRSYEELMGNNPSKWKEPDRPVERLSWAAAAQYCNVRSLREGFRPCYTLDPPSCDFTANGYRLPTEAEWEYACRAGCAEEFSFGADPQNLSAFAWFKDNANVTTHPVGQKAPNPWGLFDMHGNVWEWCNDYYVQRYLPMDSPIDPEGPTEGENRILRGGGWNSPAEDCRSASRHAESPALADVCFGYEAYGFRCVRRADDGE
ncbi:MAG TPA: formylglycine-generating enzyme family protein [bacterium]|nr:formylglycine-generating enzyme family protein [bacterium]